MTIPLYHRLCFLDGGRVTSRRTRSLDPRVTFNLSTVRSFSLRGRVHFHLSIPGVFAGLHPCAHSLVSFIHHSFNILIALHSLKHLLIHSFIHSFIHSLIHSLIHSFTHSLYSVLPSIRILSLSHSFIMRSRVEISHAHTHKYVRDTRLFESFVDNFLRLSTIPIITLFPPLVRLTT